ncbi:MAG: electron transport complex subunit E [Bacillota bacterium]|nr:electron transport complex subunit E [Bacillota bacterium]
MPEKKTSLRGVFVNGILNENPTFRLVLGVCPTLAATTSATNGLGMGLAATFVLVGSNAVISMLRNLIPDKVRIPAFIVVISTFVTIVQMLIQAFVPALYDALGLFIPLIVVNCIILARAEAFAAKNPVIPSAVDGLGMGLGFTAALLLIGSIREILGSGTIFGNAVFGPSFEPMLLVIMAPGGFIVFGLVLGIINAIVNRASARKGAKA